MVRPRVSLLAPLLAGLGLLGCAGNNLASQIAKRPAYEPEGQAKSGVEKSQARPLIVEWPSADRAQLEAETKRAIVAVRYDGRTIELLTDCHAGGRYDYTPTTPEEARETIRDADELHAKLPLGAAGLLGKLETSGSLNVAMTIVGRYKADRASVREGELEGQSCGRATHVILALTTGAFEFFAGAEANVGAGVAVQGADVGGKSTAHRELLNRGGDRTACEKATAADKAPPYGCGALIRIEVMPVAAGGGEKRAETTAPEKAKEKPEPAAAAGAAGKEKAEPPEEPHTGALPQGTIERVLKAEGGKIRACYINGLSADPALRGKVVVRFVIGTDGAVQKAVDSGSDLPDKDVIGCITGVIKQARFPRPTGGSVASVYPILFTP